MDKQFYDQLVWHSMNHKELPDEIGYEVLESQEVELLPLLNAAFEVRKKFFHREVWIHIINNVQNGSCSEDCHYCAQSKDSQAEIVHYPMKSDEEILEEAKMAYESGAARYCMVFSGRGLSEKKIDRLVDLIVRIKKTYPIEVCVSPGMVDSTGLKRLKEAGLNRLNHNLNTSEKFYPSICTSHRFTDRLKTIKLARDVGLEVCSGVIIGMGESIHDVIEMVRQLGRLKVSSIPVNFLIPIPGNVLRGPVLLSPEYCLRVLCLFRFMNPQADIRAAAGREMHLRDLEVMCLYPANSLFLDGYLNTKGSHSLKTLKMIQDAGFILRSEKKMDELLIHLEGRSSEDHETGGMKSIQDLRPLLKEI